MPFSLDTERFAWFADEDSIENTLTCSPKASIYFYGHYDVYWIFDFEYSNIGFRWKPYWAGRNCIDGGDAYSYTIRLFLVARLTLI